MEKFSEWCKANEAGFIGNNRAKIQSIVKILGSSQELRTQIDELFERAGLQEYSRTQIFDPLSEIIEFAKSRNEFTWPEIVTEDWLYFVASRRWLPQFVDQNDVKYIIARRRGSSGGFSKSPLPEDQFSEEQEQVEIQKLEEQIVENTNTIEKAEEQGRRLEKFYYPSVLKWAQQNGFERCEITGGLIPGPRWENPDLLEIYSEFNPYTSYLNFEITSFEVKLRVEPQAVWQAAHYSRFSHYSFVAFALSEAEVRSSERVFEMAVQLGLGILVLKDGLDPSGTEFKLIHSPVKNSPSASEVELIISRFLDADRFTATRRVLEEEKKKMGVGIVTGINFIAM